MIYFLLQYGYHLANFEWTKKSLANMTGLPSACSDHDSVADKARNDKTRKEEHDSVADKVL